MSAVLKVLKLQEDQTANNTGEWKEWSGTGEGTLQVVGTWDGATVTIQGTLDRSKTGIAPSNSAYTADAIVPFSMGRGWVRAVVSGVGTTSLSVLLSKPERP